MNGTESKAHVQIKKVFIASYLQILFLWEIQDLRCNQMLPEELFLLSVFLSSKKIPFLQCHLVHIKLMSIGNNRSCQWWSGLYVLDEPAASYLSSAKVPIDWSTDCASVSPPVQPFPLPPPLAFFLTLPTPIHPSSYPCPRPHWSPMPQLLPTDHSAWCLLCLGEVNKLSGQSKWGPQGPEEPLNATEGQKRRKTKDGSHWTDGREEKTLWFGGNKRDVFRRTFSALWQKKASPCPCKHLSVSGDVAPWKNTASVQWELVLKKLLMLQANYRSDRQMLIPHTEKVCSEKVVTRPKKKPWKKITCRRNNQWKNNDRQLQLRVVCHLCSLITS